MARQGRQTETGRRRLGGVLGSFVMTSALVMLMAGDSLAPVVAADAVLAGVFLSTEVPERGLFLHRTGRACEPRSSRRSRGASEDPAFVMGFSLFGGGVDRNYMASDFGGGAFYLGGEVDGRVRGQLEIGFRSYDEESLVGYSPIKDQAEWYVGGSGRFYFSPPSQSVRGYSMVGFTMGATTWDYAEPILVDVYNPHGYWVGEDLVGDDRLWTGSVYAGGGASLVGGRGLELGVNGRVGVQFYDEELRSGLRNDLFEAEAYAAIGIEVGLLATP